MQRGDALPMGRYYVVVWDGDVPVGQYWGDENVPRTFPAEVTAEGEARSLSVVICTRDRAEDLRRAIVALLASDDPDFELVIVDNASVGNATEEVVRSFPNVKYVREDRPGLDHARNAGAMAATRDIVAYTDDDVEVAANWTRVLKTAFADPMTMAVTGLVLPKLLDTAARYAFERHWSFAKGYAARTFDHEWFLAHDRYSAPVWDIGAGANMAFRREIFQLAGGFDPRLDVGASGCSGDSEMWYRVLAEGWNCRYLPSLVVYHTHRPTIEGLRKQLYYYMRGHVSALLVQYERYGRRGDLRRVFQALPGYYLRRLFGGWRTGFTEVAGSVAGWRYYRRTARVAVPRWGAAPVWAAPAAGMVSVVIPSYNHGRFLGAAIASVLDQTHTNVEVIVVDDGSTDDTEAVCAGYPGVRYVRVHRVGPCAARNIGVAYSRGDFLVFLDADDVLYPNALEVNLYYFSYKPELAFVSGAHDRIDEKGRPLDSPAAIGLMEDNYKALLAGNYIGMEATVMYRRALFFHYYFDPSVVSCEDYDLNLRIARQFPVLGHTHKVAAYRIHGRNRSGDKAAMARSAIQVLRKQEPYLITPEEISTYRQGLDNWAAYYRV